MKDFITKYINLFPEEALYAGLKNLTHTESLDAIFEKRFSEHLEYYENSLFRYPFEKINKLSNWLTYSLLMNKPLNKADIATVLSWVSALPPQLDLAGKLATDNYSGILKVYEQQFGVTLPVVDILQIKSTDTIIPIPDFATFLQSVYGLQLPNEEYLLNQLATYKAQIIEGAVETDVSKMNISEIEKFLKALFDKLNIPLPKITLSEVPPHLSNFIPTASAYWFNRVDMERSEFQVFIKNRENYPLAKLLMIISHEVLGHINHFDLVHNFCEDPLKRLPYLTRLPLTEGIALIAEDIFYNLASTDPSFVQDIVAVFSSKKTGDVFRKELNNAHKRSKILRILRALFEQEVYIKGKGRHETIRYLASIGGLDQNELQEDLLPFLYTPGYASCYFGGYSALLGKVNLTNSKDRNKLGQFGFDFIQDYA